LKEAGSMSMMLFKIMIPVSIVVKLLQEFNLISYIGNILSPVMKLVGLPGEMGLVWATTLIANIYGGIIAFFSLHQTIQISVAQMTVLTTMMLVAHTFPVELTVARKAGVKLLPMFIIRFSCAFLLGIILNLIYSHYGFLQQKLVIGWKPSAPVDPSLKYWIIDQLKNYGMIYIIILSLLTLIKLLSEFGLIKLMNKALKPFMALLGIGENIIPVSIIGLTLGVAYGGALIIKESQQHPMNRRDVFYSFVLMGLCHSIIEDSLVMISLGANYTGIIIARVIFAFLMTLLIVKLTSKLSESKMYKYFLIH
jgi:spore maturation protein SpmB